MNFKILIIDDEPEMLNSMAILIAHKFQDERLQVICCDNAHDAQKLIPEAHGIFADVNMDAGNLVTKALQKSNAVWYRITGDLDYNTSENIIYKPFRINSIYAAIDLMLTRYR